MPHRQTTSQDWQQVADLIADASAAESTPDVVEIVIRRAHALFDAEIVICDRFDESARQIAFQMYPAPTPKFVDLTLAPFLAFWHQHPFQSAWVTEIAGGRVAFLSDRVSTRDFQKTDLWNEAYVHLRAKNQIMFGGEIEPNRYYCLSCNRLGRDFTSRDRELGRFLQLRLTKLFQRIARRDRANHSAALLRHSASAYLVVDPKGEILEASAKARELLNRPARNPPAPDRLPDLAMNRNAPPVPGTITRHSIRDLEAFALHPTPNGPALVILGRAEALVAHPDGALTSREAEIFHWVGAGKNNAEIALLLGISPRTVEKHCETLFAKLGVESRLAAALLAHQGR